MPVIEFLHENAPLFVVLGAIATILGLVFGIYQAAHNRQLRALREEVRQKTSEITRLKRDGVDQFWVVNDRLQKQLDEAQTVAQVQRKAFDAATRDMEARHAADIAACQSEKATLEQGCQHLQQTTQALTQELEKAQGILASKEHADRTRAKLLQRAMKLEGRVWERKVLQGIPRFRPLAERHAAVISVLNLKGGVGKTTVAAHLGAALSSKGYNVLLLDLDLQGSLSSLFINDSNLAQRSREKLHLQHFLTKLAEGRKVNLLEYCVPIFDGKGAIVPNADSMAYAELNLTMQWLFRLGKRDTRFLLRKALQQKRVTRRYDIVLLDCPPLFNTCCVNALAGSDYVLIPVLPSKKAAERVPLLLERLHSLHRVINPELQLMGLLINRTHATRLTAWERDLWTDTRERAQDQWKLPVHAFETPVRQMTAVRDSENEFTSPAPGSELYTVFGQIAAELEARLPRDCRRAATVPFGPG